MRLYEVGGRVKSERENGGWGEERKERCRQVCDLFKELEGSGGGAVFGGRWEEGADRVVAMAMTWNAHVAPGNSSLAISSHRLMGPRPRPVPLPSVTDSRNPSCHEECRWDRECQKHS